MLGGHIDAVGLVLKAAVYGGDLPNWCSINHFMALASLRLGQTLEMALLATPNLAVE